MTTSRELLDALEAVEDTRNRLKSLAQTKPEGWVKDYAVLRATLREKMGTLVASGQAWFRAGGDDASGQEFARLVEASKSAMERHQARWPVVVIDHDNPQYVESMATVDNCTNEVGRFVRAKVRR